MLLLLATLALSSPAPAPIDPFELQTYTYFVCFCSGGPIVGDDGILFVDLNSELLKKQEKCK